MIPPPCWPRPAAAVIALLIGLLLSGCSERPEGSLEPVSGSDSNPWSTAAAAADWPAADEPAEGYRGIEFAVVAATVSRVRGLERDLLVPQIISVSQARADLTQYVHAEDAEAANHGDRIYRLLGVLGPGERYNDFYLAELSDQILGFYDSDDDEIFLVDKRELPTTSAVLTFSHEYVHALQQSHFDIAALLDDIDPLDHDRRLALLALIEGDASIFGLEAVRQLAALDETVDLGQLRDIEPASTRDLTRAGQLARAVIEYTYLRGSAFAFAQYAADGIAAINALYANPPPTTALINGFAPAPGSGDRAEFDDPQFPCWQVVAEAQFGQFLLGAVLSQRPHPQVLGPAGWVDDHLMLLSSGSQDLLLLRVVFDQDHAAATFKNGLDDHIAGGGIPVARDNNPGQGEVRTVSTAISGHAVTLAVGDHALSVDRGITELSGNGRSSVEAADFCPDSAG